MQSKMIRSVVDTDKVKLNSSQSEKLGTNQAYIARNSMTKKLFTE